MLSSIDRIKGSAWVLILIGFCNIAVLAQPSDEDTKPELEQVDDYLRVVEENKEAVPRTNTTATRLPVPIRLTPAHIGIVPLALNESQDNVILGDALRNVSGVNVMTNFGVHDFFTIRGYDSLTSSLVLTDNAPEPEATFYNLYNIERVEVLKGPGAFAYGGNPLSGTVNLVRKQPVFDEYIDFSTGFGSYDTNRNTVDAGVSNANAGLAFRVNGLWQQSDGYRDDKENEAYGLNPALLWKITERSSLNVNLEIAGNEYQPDSGLPFLGDRLAEVPRTRSYQSPSDLSEQDLARIRVDYQNRISDTLTLRNRFYHTDLEWRSKGTVFAGIQPNEQTTQLELLRVQSQLNDRQKFTGNQFELLFQRGGRFEHQWLLGAEFTRNADTFDLRQFALFPIDLFNPVEFSSEPLPFEVAPPAISDGRSLVSAAYGMYRVQFSDQIQAFLGGRYDHIDYEADILGSGGNLPIDREYDEFSPMVGFVYAPNERFTLYLNGAESFAPPSTLALGNAEPENSRQVELGTKHNFMDGRFAATVSIYDLEKENLPIPDETGITRQVGDQRSRGFEFEFIANPGNDWRIFTAFAYTDAELTQFTEFIDAGFFTIFNDYAGNTPAFAPEKLVNTWVTKTFANGLGFGAGGRYVDRQFISEDNGLGIDDYTVFDAALFYNAKRWRLAVNFKNLNDEEYQTRGIKTPFVGSVIPASPFEANGSIRFKF